MFVIGQFGPEAPEYAVAHAGDEGGGRVGGGGGEGPENEFRGGHFGEVRGEEGFPWCGGERAG